MNDVKWLDSKTGSRYAKAANPAHASRVAFILYIWVAMGYLYVSFISRSYRLQVPKAPQTVAPVKGRTRQDDLVDPRLFDSGRLN
jgi:hypothetical protein